MKGYRTAIFNAAVAVLPAIDWVANNGSMIGGLLGPNAAVALSVVGLANIVLRWATTSPIFKPE